MLYLMLAGVVVAAMATGCASSASTTAQAPPETPEKPLPAATTPEQPASGQPAVSGSSGSSGTGGGDGAGGVPSGSGGPPPAGSAATSDEAASALEAELALSADEFDAKMLEELRRLAAEAAARTGESDPPSGSAGGAGGVGGEAGAEEPGAVGGASPGASGSGAVPPDVGDGSDDDIVARQLREAAIAEEDPALKEKLWDEYRRYKASVGGSSQDDS
jgi:hypothetical protein